MKRYLVQLTALSLLALATGCQKEEGEINNPQNNQSAAVNISIDGLSIDVASSRAVIVDMPDFSKNKFKIAGYYTKGASDASTSGRFDDNTTDATPNVFDANGKIGESVIVPELKNGKYHVMLSQWALLENSYLSYFAWASNVEAGVAEGAAENPIKSSTKHGSTGAPFIQVISGDASASLNVDVVAAKSADNSNNVVRSAIDLDFKHVMTKLKFNVKNSSSVTMTLTGAKILFAAGKVYRGAKYSFDGTLSPLGTWGNYTDNEVATYPVTLTNTNLASNALAVHLEELLIIPQTLAAGAISVELTYTIPNGASASTYTRTVPLKARTVEQNTSYTYEIALNETTISISEGRIGAWIDAPGDLPFIVGARDPNVQLLLDGYDPPYTHTDGNQYWLDRSGWNRHCKLVGGVTYDVAGKFYKFSDSPAGASYLDVPKTFTATTGVTFETITRSTRPVSEISKQYLFSFEGSSGINNHIMLAYFGVNGTEVSYFNAGGNTGGSDPKSRVTSTIPQSLYREFAMYAFTKGPSTHSIRRNLVYVNNTLTFGEHCAANLADVTTAQIGSSFKGEIKYFKITTTAKTTIDAKDYAALSKRHRVKNTDYVDEGLLFDLRGMDAPVDGRWYERVTGASVATSGLAYDNYWKEYKINNSVRFDVTNYYKGTTLPELTVEFVGHFDSFWTATFTEPVTWGDVACFRFHEITDCYQWTSPNAWGPSFARIYHWIKLPPDKFTYSCSRKNIGLNVELISYRSNVFAATLTEAVVNSLDYPPTTCTLGGGLGCLFSATRLYNRKLTDSERLWNYNLDKKVYEGIP